MPLFDYAGPEGDKYHQSHPKDLQQVRENPVLTKSWGEYALKTYFPDLGKGKRVLEVGAGFGRNLVAVKNHAEVLAVEPGGKAREECNALGIKTFSKIEELPAGKSFDFILLRHVLEHVPEPRNLLAKLSQYLSPSGEFVIVLPVEPPFANIKTNDIDYHLYSWNRQTIANFLKDAGYQVKACRLHWHNGRKLLIFLYKIFGLEVYAAAIRFFGRLRGVAEIIVTASPDKGK